METPVILETKKLSKYFYDPVKLQVLKEVNLSIRKGEFVSIVGKSGCGKSTLLYLLSTMDTDYEGEIYLEGQLMPRKADKVLARVRNEKIGFVFQFHYLLNEYNVLRNVMIPGIKLGKLKEEALEARAMELLTTLDMQDHALKNPSQLSGGQKQRVAIARALINEPVIIMGDEPTGNLDKKNTDLVFDIFKELTDHFHQTMLIVTHDRDFAARSHRIVEMDDGRIIRQ